MKVFVSSVITGFEAFRAAAREAIETLRHQPVMAEDFGARADSPQMSCLSGLQSADLVLLIVGGRYGAAHPASGLSPTHEEYEEAKATKPILMYVQSGVDRDERQTRFLDEAQEWQGGQLRDAFSSPEQLRRLILADLHDYELSHAAGPLDAHALRADAEAALPDPGRQRNAGVTVLNLSLTPGPLRKVMRPAQLEDSAFEDELHQRALFGEPRLMDKTKGIEPGRDNGALTFQQEGGARLRLDESGRILLSLPLGGGSERRRGAGQFVLSIIQEDVERSLGSGLAYMHWLLERIDPTRRLSHLALAASIDGGEHMGWRTQAEQDASPKSATVRMGGASGGAAVVDLPRSELRLQPRLAQQDLLVTLRRLRSA